jgi:hypothetical protein
MTGIAVCVLAFLNPLLCLIHCAHLFSPPAPLSENQQQFLCDLVHGASPDGLTADTGPFAAVWVGPRAVYEAVPVPLIAVVVLPMILVLVAVSAMGAPQHYRTPELARRAVPAGAPRQSLTGD